MEDDTLKKVVLHSVATALASMVLPVPGGPNISTPCRGPNNQHTLHRGPNITPDMEGGTITPYIGAPNISAPYMGAPKSVHRT